MSGEWKRVGPADAVKDGQPVSVEVGPDERVCVVRRGNDFYAINDRCSHAESLLSPGEVEDFEILCPLHGARFDLRTGEALTPPASRPVPVHETKVEGTDLFVRIKPGH